MITSRVVNAKNFVGLGYADAVESRYGFRLEDPLRLMLMPSDWFATASTASERPAPRHELECSNPWDNGSFDVCRGTVFSSGRQVDGVRPG